MKTALTGEHITPIDALTDEAVDAILSGRMQPPQWRPWTPIRVQREMRPRRRCGACGKVGHERRNCA